MRRNFLPALAVCLALNTTYSAYAQQSNSKTIDSDEIIIRKKGDKNSKVTVEFKDGQVTVNGKALSDYNDGDVTISRRRYQDDVKRFQEDAKRFQDEAKQFQEQARRNMATTSPFRGGTFYNNNNDLYYGNKNDLYLRGYSAAANSNKALLGVATEKTENGARITSVTKSSAAEKGGLKEGDVITKVDNTAVTNPEELTAAVGKYKPEDKVTVTYKRDNKEQKAAVTLGKRAGATTFGPGGFTGPDFNFDMLTPGQDGGYNFIMRGNNLRLGIKAQDTEDGKGVKVLDVDDASNAAKAGIKQGDVITAFDGQTVNSVSDLMDAAKDMKDKNSIKVKLSREGKQQEVEIKVPKKLKTATL